MGSTSNVVAGNVRNKEIYRQALHILLGILLVIGVELRLLNWWIVLLAAVFFASCSLAHHLGFRIPIISHLYVGLGRKDELRHLPARGMIFYLIGSGLALLFFSKPVALAAVLILAFGDAFSTVVGKYGDWRHVHNMKKTVEGTIAGSLLATLAASLYVGIIPAFIVSVASLLVETMDLRIGRFYLDDNLYLPLLAGALLLLLGV